MEERTKVLIRNPPGDRWMTLDKETHFESLIDGLNDVFEQTGIRQFFIDAINGFVHTVEDVEVEPTPPRRYSLYDE